MKPDPSYKSQLNFVMFALLMLFAGVIFAKGNQHFQDYRTLILIALSIAGYFLTFYLIPIVKIQNLEKGGLFGLDIHKPFQKEKIPESLGIVVGMVYLVIVILFQPFFTERLGLYNAAMTGICLMLFLGFLDDVLDVRWRIKIQLTFLAVLPLLVAYHGSTTIVIPKPFVAYLGSTLNLSYFYHGYMAFIAVFCTNGINIYAGVNGLEVHQSVVIACAVMIHNLLEIDGPFKEGHILSLFLTLPFFSCSLALLFHNWYPASVFVGDSYTYFAGMTLATAGILGQFSKTLLLFFIPQLFNFAISLPQLFGIVHCPRHRLPQYNPEDRKLHATRNFNLINFYLYFSGPLTEQQLSFHLMVLQVLCCALGFAVRYSHAVTNIFYDSNYQAITH